MKTLALFAIICLGLLVFAAWHLRSISGGVAPEDELPPRTSQELPSVTVGDGITPLQAPSVGDTPIADDSSERGEDEPVSSSTPSPLNAVARLRADPDKQPIVRWAGDDEQRRVRQRFFELRSTLTDDPDNEPALEAALECARRLDWHHEACDLLARLVRLHPEDAALRFQLAVLLMRLERWLEAVPQLRFVVERQPDNEQAWYNLAIAHQALGHLRDARATWNRVLDLMPENPDAYAHRGEVLLDLRAWDAAAGDLETSLRLEPGSLEVTMNLSLALAKLGQADEARDQLLPFVKRNPIHVPLLNRLAELTWTLYQANPATNKALANETVEYCTRSLAVNDNQPEVKTLRARAAQVAD